MPARSTEPLSADPTVRATQLQIRQIDQDKARLRREAERRKAALVEQRQRDKERARRGREQAAATEQTFEEKVGALLGAGLAAELAPRITANPEGQLSWLALGCHLGAAFGRSLPPK